jgi:hypothetical protein
MWNSKVFSRQLKRFAMLLVVFHTILLTGCASIVYKDSATTYVAASRNLIKAMNDASNAAAVAADAAKISELVKDRRCPIADRDLYIRKPTIFSKEVMEPLSLFPTLKNAESCKALLACNTAGPDYCRNACLISEEGNCLAQIEQNLVILKKEKPNDKGLQETAGNFQRVLGQVQVGRLSVSATDLAELGLAVFGEYLDLLGKLAEKDTSDLEARATVLNTRLGDRVKNYLDITGRTLSTGAEAEQKAVGEYLGTLGKLAADIQVLSRNARDADQIKRIVTENVLLVDKATSSIQSIVRMETTAATVYANQSAKAARKSIQGKFASASNEYDRLMIYNEITKYPVAKYEAGISAIEVIFKALDESHASLVQLIKSPSEEQLKKIRNEKFQSFKTIAGDFVALGKLFL